MRTRSAFAGALATVGVASAVVAASASAYSHSWYRYSSPPACTNLAVNTRCYDNQGQIYNNWKAVGGSAGQNLPEICAKSITSSGTLRTSTTGGYCNYNYSQVAVPYSASTPASYAYVYWNNNGYSGNVDLGGTASTP